MSANASATRCPGSAAPSAFQKRSCTLASSGGRPRFAPATIAREFPRRPAPRFHGSVPCTRAREGKRPWRDRPAPTVSSSAPRREARRRPPARLRDARVRSRDARRSSRPTTRRRPAGCTRRLCTGAPCCRTDEPTGLTPARARRRRSRRRGLRARSGSAPAAAPTRTGAGASRPRRAEETAARAGRRGPRRR
jgi:hypothetical protein